MKGFQKQKTSQKVQIEEEFAKINEELNNCDRDNQR